MSARTRQQAARENRQGGDSVEGNSDDEPQTPNVVDAQRSASIAPRPLPSRPTTAQRRPEQEVPHPGQDGPESPSEAQDGPLASDLDEELRRMRQWREDELKKLELAELQAMYIRVAAGDTEALKSPFKPSESSRPSSLSNMAGLPKPDKPQQFAKANRAQYNRWERDCEHYMRRVPQGFSSEEDKVVFGARYISEPLKTLWEAHTMAEKHANPLWEPTWEILKTVMLNSLGSPQERRQYSYECLKRAHQRANQSPTDLLDYMRPHWEELGSSRTPDIMVHEYVAALREDIRKALLLLPGDRRATIPQVEEHANLLYRQKDRSADSKGTQPKERENSAKRGAETAWGSKIPPKSAKQAKTAHNGPKWAKPAPPSSGSFKGRCYKCKEIGHISPNCPNGDKADKATPDPASTGKGQGRR
jgi:hypothetical protein